MWNFRATIHFKISFREILTFSNCVIFKFLKDYCILLRMTNSWFDRLTPLSAESFPFTHLNPNFLPLNGFSNLLLVHPSDGELSWSLLTLFLINCELEITLVRLLYLGCDAHTSMGFMSDTSWSGTPSAGQTTLWIHCFVHQALSTTLGGHLILVLNVNEGTWGTVRLLCVALVVLFISFVSYFYRWFHNFWSNLSLWWMRRIFWTWRLYILRFVNWFTTFAIGCLILLTTCNNKLLESFFSCYS